MSVSEDAMHKAVEAAMLAMWPDAVDIQFPRGVFANPYQFVRAGVVAALSAIEQDEGEGWQDIASAPKVPHHPLLLSVTKIDGRQIVGEAYWHDGENSWWWAQTGPGEYHDNPIDDIGTPTHWRYLPDPPTPADRNTPAAVEMSKPTLETDQ